MQFTIIAVAALMGFTNAAAVTKRYQAMSVPAGDAGGVCGPLATPLCCQTDILGVANLACENTGPVASRAAFDAQCAKTGTSAQCCVIPVGSLSLLCTGA
ncbi:hydrophobin 5 [Stemphylium lycopersici]|nr:hydrophobin 5 [Stemphylium lycopersici]RAR09758.1 hydrophobin 5 [Stemphylium lycopersici]